MKHNKATRNQFESGNDLGKLREEMGDITRSILDLAKARQVLSKSVALVKDSSGFQIENKLVESSLLHSMEEYAKTIGLDLKLAREITKALIESSKSAQRKATYFKKIKGYVESRGIRQVGIVGAGRMGGWFAGYFRPLVSRVVLFDQDRKFASKRAKEFSCSFSSSLDEVAKSDLIFIAVPISDAVREIELTLKLTRKGNEGTRIIEISSVKEPILKGVGKNSQVSFVHPLFGPSAGHFASNFLITTTSSKRDDGLVRGLFPQFKILNLSASEHDRLMALVLCLPHVLTLIFAEIASNEEAKHQNEISSPSYDSFVEISRKTLSENPRVYYEIQSLNKYSQEMMKEIRKSLERFESLVSKGRFSDFERFFVKTRKALS